MSYEAYRDSEVQIGPFTRSFVITPSDSADLAEVPRAVIAAGVGNVNVVLAGESSEPNYLTGGYTLGVAAASHAASKVRVTIVDTTPSIIAGFIYVTGTVGGEAGVTEIIDASGGAGDYDTVQLFTKVISIKTSGFTVLDGGGDETITALWLTGAESVSSVVNLVEQSILPAAQTVFALTANVPLDIAVKRVLSTSTTATGIKGLI